MVQSFNYAYEHGKLNITQKQGIIEVIPKKKRKDKSFLENWRPLSLLNVDYKIARKVIAHRIPVFFQSFSRKTKPDMSKAGTVTSVKG